MFTGLVQGIGIIKALSSDLFVINVNQSYHQVIMPDLSLGDSVAVDGICLTVEKILADGFVVTASPETLQRTTLAQSTLKNKNVNLETSLRVGSKIGGHFVSGHIDGIGCLVESKENQKAWEMTFSASPQLQSQWLEYIAPYLVSKASIAVNGISLTIADCDREGNWFKVAVIPVTYKKTNLAELKIGDSVNIEGDILGKYVARLISHRLGKTDIQEQITLDFLRENGY